MSDAFQDVRVVGGEKFEGQLILDMDDKPGYRDILIDGFESIVGDILLIGSESLWVGAYDGAWTRVCRGIAGTITNHQRGDHVCVVGVARNA